MKPSGRNPDVRGHRPGFRTRREAPLLAIAALLWFSPALPGQFTFELEGPVELNFRLDDDGASHFLGVTGTVKLHVPDEFSLLPVIPVSISSSAGSDLLLWSSASTWSPIIQVGNSLAAIPLMVDTAGAVRRLDPVALYFDAGKMVQFMAAEGPTERGFSFSLPVAVSSILETVGVDLTFETEIAIRYNVTIDKNARVTMNQPHVMLQNLTVERGTTVFGSDSMTVRSNVTNHGMFQNLGGVIQGSLSNDGGAASGGGVLVSRSLSVVGAVLNSGEIVLDPGGTLAIGGDLSNHGDISLDGGVVTLAGALDNEGAITVHRNSAFVVNSKTRNAGHLSLAGGYLDTSAGGVLTNSGTVDLLAGGVARLTLINEGTLTIAGAEAKELSSAKLLNAGVITQTPGSTIALSGYNAGQFLATIDNQAAGTYDLQGDGVAFSLGYYSNAAINNAGVFRKSGGLGEAIVSTGVPFNNTGTVEVTSGTLDLRGGGSIAAGATYHFANGGVLRLSQNTISLATDLTASGNGAFEIGGGGLMVREGQVGSIGTFSGGASFVIAGGIGADPGGTFSLNVGGQGALLRSNGALGGGGLVTNAGHLVWSGGIIGTGPVQNTGRIDVVGAGNLIYSSQLANAGSITQTPGSTIALSGYNAGQFLATIDNQAAGTYDLQGDGVAFSLGYYSNAAINNAGLFRKSGGLGEAIVSTGVPFNNTGTVEVDMGTLTFHGGVSCKPEVAPISTPPPSEGIS